jgi:hypothetical protein
MAWLLLLGPELAALALLLEDEHSVAWKSQMPLEVKSSIIQIVEDPVQT